LKPELKNGRKMKIFCLLRQRHGFFAFGGKTNKHLFHPCSSVFICGKYLLSLFLLAGSAYADKGEDFAWSWENETNVTAEVDETVPEPEPAVEPEEESVPAEEPRFSWTWDGDYEPDDSVQQNGVKYEEEVPVPSSGSSARSEHLANAYSELLAENLKLRKEMSNLKESSIREKDALESRVRKLEEAIARSSLTIESLKKRNESSANEEEEKLEMERQLRELQQKLRDMTAAQNKRDAQSDQGVKQGSDLFVEKERENAFLRQQIAELKQERERALKNWEDSISKAQNKERDYEKAVASRDELQRQLEEARSSEDQHKQIIKKLMEEIPELEKDLSQMQSTGAEAQEVLNEKEKELDTLRQELQKREYRLMKAEKMHKILQEAYNEIKETGDKDRRDMHYNVAVVYTREGRFEEAKEEYLKALKLDPNDADVHYNLGVLYDDYLDDKESAALHYRKYLLLKPHAADVDQVKDWLMKIEVTLKP